MRKYLESPCCKNTQLRKNLVQSPHRPIYKCSNCGTLWMLRISINAWLELVMYDADKGITVENKKEPISEDWEGEPNEITISRTTLNELQRYATFDYVKELKRLIDGGDIIIILDDDNQPIDRILIENDNEIKIVPLQFK